MQRIFESVGQAFRNSILILGIGSLTNQIPGMTSLDMPSGS